ncbi:MAG TPA: LysR family transcriptional regulator [Cellvibrionaceae bacterium]|nr:LysR family transcriptional regulator [Cellvibrionaceae bacterium]HMW70377.1 LysR family transcriptional regulator [Cellvibrionaceae bacterium]HMY38483.1 LysR family transcriptional regulator [Marinagarivorans sp.]HNG58368.1 LysR family transcriptional regulator [Cellvibrionaceae bacterium]
MNTQALQLFVAVARSGSFAAVARQRNQDPSLVSRSIAQLEAELGVRLFQRSTRKMLLTEAGARLLEKVQALLEELSGALEEVASSAHEPSGTLRMTASVTFGHHCVLPLLKEFRTLYPKIKIDLVLSDDPLDLIASHIDLAIRLGPSISGNLIVTKLLDCHYRVVASPDYIASSAPIVQPKDLTAHACLLFPERIFAPDWQFKRPGEEPVVVRVSGDLILSTGDALRQMALRGMGPALLPHWAILDALEDGRLVDLFPTYQAAAASFNSAAWLVYPSRDYLPKKVRVMIDYLKTHLPSRYAINSVPA